MPNQRFSWAAFALATTMSVAGMLIAVKALARHPGAHETRHWGGEALMRSSKELLVPVQWQGGEAKMLSGAFEPPAEARI